MVRAPCCEKMGMKKGPWTPEEDQILVNYIHQYGHDNWRALPKLAGLLRCGKSCRLRWTNYLRPDIKRGNFSREEEDTIINLHDMLGNRWSAIAARLPGRTDNEIKNVWHTHLKKRLKQNHVNPEFNRNFVDASPYNHHAKNEPEPMNFANQVRPNSPQQSSSDVSSVSTSEHMNNNNNMCMKIESSETFLQMDEDFWSEVLSANNSGAVSDFPASGGDRQPDQFPLSPLASVDQAVHGYSSNMYDSNLDFWQTLFT